MGLAVGVADRPMLPLSLSRLWRAEGLQTGGHSCLMELGSMMVGMAVRLLMLTDWLQWLRRLCTAPAVAPSS